MEENKKLLAYILYYDFLHGIFVLRKLMVIFLISCRIYLVVLCNQSAAFN